MSQRSDPLAEATSVQTLSPTRPEPRARVTPAQRVAEPMQMYIRSQDNDLFVIFTKPVDNVFDLFAQLQLLEHIEAFWIDSNTRRLPQ